MENLKPCPLPNCGGEGRVVHNPYQGFDVSCSTCEWGTGIYNSETAATMAWNKPPRAPVRETSIERAVNPNDPNERPTFLPGDKVRDKRGDGRIWRIVSRTAYWDSEMMTLREVDGIAEQSVIAKELIPHLEMVAMSAPYRGDVIEDRKGA